MEEYLSLYKNEIFEITQDKYRNSIVAMSNIL